MIAKKRHQFMRNRLCNLTIILLAILSFHSCKSKINQVKNNLQEGMWITVDTFDYPYVSKGKYKKGIQTGSWKYFYNGKLDRKERYNKNKCLTRFYHPNGKVKQKEFTKLDDINNNAHWYYLGAWKYYDETGKLTHINIFENGKIMDTIIKSKKK